MVRIRCSPARRPDAGVLVVGLEVQHVGDVDLVRHVALAGADVAKRRASRRGEQLAQDGGQARVGASPSPRLPRVARAGAGARRRQLALQPLDRAREPIGLDRLEDVVERLLLERGDRELVERGDEDDPRRALDALRDVEAGQAGHLDVEEGDVGLRARRSARPPRRRSSRPRRSAAPARPSSAARAGRPRGAARRRRSGRSSREACGHDVDRQRQRGAHAARLDGVEVERGAAAVRLAQPVADVGERGAAAGAAGGGARRVGEPGAVVVDRDDERARRRCARRRGPCRRAICGSRPWTIAFSTSGCRRQRRQARGRAAPPGTSIAYSRRSSIRILMIRMYASIRSISSPSVCVAWPRPESDARR